MALLAAGNQVLSSGICLNFHSVCFFFQTLTQLQLSSLCSVYFNLKNKINNNNFKFYCKKSCLYFDSVDGV